MHLALLGIYVTALMWPQVPQLQSVPAGVSVAGRIVDAESRSPIPGARVMLMPTARMFPPGAAGPLQAVTDANGQFVFEAVAPGRYRIDAQKTGFAPLADPASPRDRRSPVSKALPRSSRRETSTSEVTAFLYKANPCSPSASRVLRGRSCATNPPAEPGK
jgi:hypothetical protein